MAWSHLSISKKLPLGISGLLLVVLGGMAVAAYVEVRRSAFDAADERLGRLTQQVVDLLTPQTRSRLTAAQALAERPALRDFLSTNAPAERTAAINVLTAFAARTPQVTTMELWDSTGGRQLVTGESLPPLPDADRREMIAQLRVDSVGAVISPFRIRADSALTQATVGRIDGPTGPLGYVVDRRGRPAPTPAQVVLDAARVVAARAAVAEFLGTHSAAATTAVLDTLGAFETRTPQVRTVELWDADGARQLVVGDSLPPIAESDRQQLIARLNSDTAHAIVGTLKAVGDTSTLQVAVARIDGPRGPVGYFLDRDTRLGAAPTQTTQALAALIGSNATLLLGNAADEVWTDLVKAVPGPPLDVRGATRAVRYERATGGQVVGAVRPIPQTPWLFVVEFPEESIFGRSRQFLLIAISLALALAAAGGFTGWVMSRRITMPLQRLTEGAEAITAGRLSLRVNLERSDELGRLARSFNTMAGEVEISHRHLETLVDRYRLLFDQNPLPMWLYDRKTRAFLDANSAATERYGYSRAEFLSMTVESLLGPKDVPRLAAGPDAVPDNGQLTQHHLKDGRVIDVEMTRHDIELDGRPVALALADDVTARVAAERARQAGEEAVRRLNVELERRVHERTAALEASNQELEAFSYSVSHDLRAPLRAIAGFSRILIEDHGTALPNEAQDYLNVITRNSKQMGQLIDDLLTFSRLGRQPLSQAPVDMTALAQAVGDDALAANPDRTIEFTVEPLPPAHGERALLRQVFENLIQNGVKFTRTQPSARVEVGHRAGSGEDIYFVRDNGAGFDMRYVDKLFGVFQRLHRAEEFEGTGVGLAIVQRIVNRHGGRVWAESTLGQGATFFFSLPHTTPS